MDVELPGSDFGGIDDGAKLDKGIECTFGRQYRASVEIARMRRARLRRARPRPRPRQFCCFIDATLYRNTD